MGGFGNFLGSIAGSLGQKLLPIPGVDGGQLGGAIGSLLPFSSGGKVPGKRGKAKVILAHGGEYILPANAKPTKVQKAIVAKNKVKAKAKARARPRKTKTKC